MPRAHEHDVRTSPERLGAAHRGVDPELPRLVVRRCHDAATARIAADDEGLRAERRVLELLHGGEERVEIEVRDDHAPSVTGGAVVADGPSPVSLRRRRHAGTSSVSVAKTSPSGACRCDASSAGRA